MIKRLLMILVLLALSTLPVNAEEISTYTWTAPTEGSTVHHYIVAVSMGGNAFVQLMVEPTVNTVDLAFEPNTDYSVRVAAVDAEGRQGEWSEASDPYSYQLPGLCGKPERI